jgi:signal peptidase II
MLRKAYSYFILLLVDQVSKIHKTNFILGEEVEVFKWFKIFLLKMKEWLGTEILVRTENYFNAFDWWL